MNLRKLKRLSVGAINGRTEFISHFQDAREITGQIKKAEYNSRGFSKKLVPFFKSNDKELTCKRVWTFLKIAKTYKAESGKNQTAMTIPRIILAKSIDCKHYATFAVGVLNACGIPAWFAIVRQSADKSKWHAYCNAIVGSEIITIDPCREKYNSECRFVKKYNVSPIKN